MEQNFECGIPGLLLLTLCPSLDIETPVLATLISSKPRLFSYVPLPLILFLLGCKCSPLGSFPNAKLPFFESMASSSEIVSIGIFLLSATLFCRATLIKSSKERFTDSSGIPRYRFSSSCLALANVALSPIARSTKD